MANTKISQAYSKPALEATDMIPVASQGQLTAYHVTGQALFDSLPGATTASKGAVELATQAETKAGADCERAITPASLLGAIGPKMVAKGLIYIGYVENMNAVGIDLIYQQVCGRAMLNGDIAIWDGPYPDYGFYLGVYHSAAGKVYAFNLRDGSHLIIP
jgi:hypothetical protein